MENLRGDYGLAYNRTMLTNHIIYNNTLPWRFDLQKAEGSYLWAADGTADGKRLIDFSSGWNVANLGWNHPEVAEAVARQTEANVYAPMWTADPMQNKYAALLTSVLPDGLDAVARATGGTEANEMAIKMARVTTGRTKIIGIRDSYHGQLFASLALGYRPEYVEALAPLVPDFIQLDYPSADRSGKTEAEALQAFREELEALLTKGDVAAILTEAGIVTGWGNTSVAPEGYLALVRKLTEQYGTLLILDEVGTGFSRCGTLFGLEKEGVVPDIVTFAKGISNGAGAIGAVVTTAKIADATYGKAKLTSTFGWNPLACAAAHKTLEIHMRDKVWEKAAADGRYLIETLREELADVPHVKTIRGIGMELGVELEGATSEGVVAAAHEQGLHLCTSASNVLQIMPPLTIERAVLDEGVAVLVNAIKQQN
jgi:4-aminobutyrate aminotransferase-like enzyme